MIFPIQIPRWKLFPGSTQIRVLAHEATVPTLHLAPPSGRSLLGTAALGPGTALCCAVWIETARFASNRWF